MTSIVLEESLVVADNTDNADQEQLIPSHQITKELRDMKQEIAKLWSVIYNTIRSAKSDCGCFHQIENVKQENRLLQEHIKEVKRERDALFLSISLLSKAQSPGKQLAVRDKDDY